MPKAGHLTPLAQRLERHHRLTETGCWEWTGSIDEKGYGRITLGSRADGTRRPERVHRASWELFRGSIPPGMTIDHLCRNRRCFNPEHLRVCTAVENTMAVGSEAIPAKWAARTHCPKGHPLSGANVRIRAGGARECKTCFNEYKRRWRERRKAAGLPYK
jgi:hypothetical protein